MFDRETPGWSSEDPSLDAPEPHAIHMAKEAELATQQAPEASTPGQWTKKGDADSVVDMRPPLVKGAEVQEPAHAMPSEQPPVEEEENDQLAAK